MLIKQVVKGPHLLLGGEQFLYKVQQNIDYSSKVLSICEFIGLNKVLAPRVKI